jgi:hypothetical protein
MALKQLCAAAAVVLVFTLYGCGRGILREDGAAVADATRIADNKKYGLQVLFYLEEEVLLPDDGSKLTRIVRVAVRDVRSGKEAPYVPVDPTDSLVHSLGYFESVWSPNEEYLVLPAGRFDGFCIAKSVEAVNSLAAGRCPDAFRVQIVSGVRLWHEFIKWESPTSFVFKAGLSKSDVVMSYDLVSRRLTSHDPARVNLVGIGTNGRIPLGGPGDVR